MPLRIVVGDISLLDVDAIVNAANSSLLGGGGVDGAIHAAAGPELLNECRQLGGCAPGQAKLTKGYRLAARHVIHTVGPIWKGGAHGEEAVLRTCYRNCLRLVAEHRLSSVAFPSISTGAYGYPVAFASLVAVAELQAWLKSDPDLDVSVVCFGASVERTYQHALIEIRGDS